VTALLGLRSQYEAQLAQLQDFYSTAERYAHCTLTRATHQESQAQSTLPSPSDPSLPPPVL
jgi:hypothetical protein